MTIDVSNGRRFTDEPAAEAIGSDEDVLLIRMADGSGVKRLPVGVLAKYLMGSTGELKTEDKTLIGAINELVGVNDGEDKKIAALQEIVGNYNNAGFHNSVYRGKNLGSAVTDGQWTAIKAGTFEDLFIGDYWTIGNVVYRIAAFDYYLRSGDTECTKHHITLVPDSSLYNAKMNDTNVTTGGYVGSAMYKTNLASAKTTISNAFGATHILNHRLFLCNAVSNGAPSARAWVDSILELMTEQNVYEGKVLGPMGDGQKDPWSAMNNYEVDKSQYPLFAKRPDLISNRLDFWLRDVVTGATFASVSAGGFCYYCNASNSFGVRPAFSICQS